MPKLGLRVDFASEPQCERFPGTRIAPLGGLKLSYAFLAYPMNRSF